MEQLESYLPALEVTLTDDVLDRIDEIVSPRSRSTPTTAATVSTSSSPPPGVAEDLALIDPGLRGQVSGRRVEAQLGGDLAEEEQDGWVDGESPNLVVVPVAPIPDAGSSRVRASPRPRSGAAVVRTSSPLRAPTSHQLMGGSSRIITAAGPATPGCRTSTAPWRPAVLEYDLVDVERIQFTDAVPVDCVAYVANERCLLEPRGTRRPGCVRPAALTCWTRLGQYPARVAVPSCR